MRHYFTYFDFNYSCQGLTLFRSLTRVDHDFCFYVGCLDDRIFDLLVSLDDSRIIPIRLAEIEAFDSDFAACADNRSRVEYYFTLSPVLPLYLFHRFPEIDILGYMDSDLFFYSSPEMLYQELGNNSILIVGHRFPEFLRYREAFGKYNVEFQLYRRDEHGLAVLRWWREKCIEWCYDRVEPTRFADQKYLDCWPELFDGVVVTRYKGAGLAPWNWKNYCLEITPAGNITVDGESLVFYHFQGFKILCRWLLNHGLGNYHYVMPRKLLHWFYLGYCRELLATRQWLKEKKPAVDMPLTYRNIRSGFSFWRNILSGLKHRGLMLSWLDVSKKL